MSVKIVSDGTPQGTRVLDDFGMPISGVTKITWIMEDAQSIGKAIIEFEKVVIEASAEVEKCQS